MHFSEGKDKLFFSIIGQFNNLFWHQIGNLKATDKGPLTQQSPNPGTYQSLSELIRVIRVYNSDKLG